METKIELKPFSSLTTLELYEILGLRNEVFIVEQNCVYPDIDGKDLKSHHLLVMHDEKLAAYCRILPAGISFPEVSIGRVISSPFFRRKGFGQILIQAAIVHTNTLYPNENIRIGAQLYLQKFYESFGFNQVSEVYMEDGIAHIEMLLKVSS
ncbi:MAG: GNAT family N-acetyltransferase [Pedobacter sp.]|nr:MAG: GNAT family N-acetyltransferase [Pedobacter sp.]